MKLSKKRSIEGMQAYVARVQVLHKIICDRKLASDIESVQARIGITRELEKLLGTDFKDTQDFHFKIQSFLTKGRTESPGVQLKKARKKMRWTQVDLAKGLCCSQQFIAAMEKNKKPLTKEAIKFIELTSYPVFNKRLIIKQLKETDED